MAPRATTFTTGTLKRGPKGSGPLGGRVVISDTGRQIKTVISNLKSVFEGLKKGAITDALMEMGEEIVTQTTPLVPEDTGALKESWAITTDPSSDNPKVVVSYGGDGRKGFVNYAVRIHEDMQMFHESPTQAKFLSAGAELAKSNFEAIMAKHVRKALK